MNIFKLIQLFALLGAFFLVSCAQHSTSTKPVTEQYAEGFRIVEESDGVRITIFQPQDHSKVQDEYFVPADKPFSRIATSAVTHVAFLEALGAHDCIVGVCDPVYLYHPEPQAMDLGSSVTIDPERVIAADPQALILSYTTDDHCLSTLRSLGVTPIYNNEWTEHHPLGRAEWIRVMGALVGRLHEADSIFALVRDEYLREAALEPTDTSARPSIFSGSVWQGTWYVPSGNTYMGRLFADAGARYAFLNDSSAESLPLSFEQALLAFRDADVWVGAPAASLDELRSLDDKHVWFKAFSTGRVYNFNRRTRGAYANDFWETGVVRPDLILSDLRHILANDPDSTLYFSKQLQ